MPTLDVAGLERRDAARQATLDRLSASAAGRVRARVDDALAHARSALTESARREADGRPTALAIRRGRSYPAALARLDELRDGLAALCGRARSSQYRDSYRFYWAAFPPGMRRSATGRPPQGRVARCRAFALHGTTLQAELGFATGRAKQGLLGVLHAAARRDASRSDAEGLLEGWARAASASIATAARVALNDSLTLADRLAGRDAARPDLLHPDPTLPE